MICFIRGIWRENMFRSALALILLSSGLFCFLWIYSQNYATVSLDHSLWSRVAIKEFHCRCKKNCNGFCVCSNKLTLCDRFCYVSSQNLKTAAELNKKRVARLKKMYGLSLTGVFSYRLDHVQSTCGKALFCSMSKEMH